VVAATQDHGLHTVQTTAICHGQTAFLSSNRCNPL
jgi:hypothetical protein